MTTSERLTAYLRQTGTPVTLTTNDEDIVATSGHLGGVGPTVETALDALLVDAQS